jgi:hypothetical protein
VGGALRFSHFCIDNEGMSFIPLKAVLYAEPSLDGGPQGNSLHLAGVLYTGSMKRNPAVIELADGPWPTQAKSTLRIDGIDLWFPEHKLDALVLARSSNWNGTIFAQSQWNEHLEHGLVQCVGAARPDLVTLQECYTLPTQGTWRADIDRVRVPGHQDPASGAWIFKTYRCSRSGAYGSSVEPQWQELKE